MGNARNEMPAAVNVWGMHGDHTFERIEGSSPMEVAINWVLMAQNRGEFDLCPAVVIGADGSELRRVGEMVFHDTKRGGPKDAGNLLDYVQILSDDPDIPELLNKGAPVKTKEMG